MHSMAQVEALHQAGQRLTTACGDGHLVWRRWGPPEGRAVLLLHGGSGSWTHWVRNIEPLARAGRQVLVPDMPGFGESAAPPDGHDADVLPAWLERGLRSLVDDAAADMVGFSFGGLVAGLWAQAMPARVARLVLVGSPGLSAELLPVLAGLGCPLHGIWGAQDVLYRHRLPLIAQLLSRSPRFRSLELLPEAGHWVQFEAADAFNAALARALSTAVA